MISPFDLFGKGLYYYTFEMTCKEDSSIKLNDGATRIFLNSHGTNDEEVSPELIELLRYIEHSDTQTSNQCHSSRIHQLNDKIQAIKENEEVGVRYMQEWEERALEKQEAHEEGIARGKIEDILSFLEDHAPLPKDLVESIQAQKDCNLLSKWVKLAARVDSIDEFISEMDD